VFATVHFLTMSHGVQKPGVIGWMRTATEKKGTRNSVVTAFVAALIAADYPSGYRDGAVPTAKMSRALMIATFSSFGRGSGSQEF